MFPQVVIFCLAVNMAILIVILAKLQNLAGMLDKICRANRLPNSRPDQIESTVHLPTPSPAVQPPIRPQRQHVQIPTVSANSNRPGPPRPKTIWGMKVTAANLDLIDGIGGIN